MSRRSKNIVARRGMTLLEVVLASVLLALLASAMVSAVVYAQRSEGVRIKRLMAYDVANRLLLQFVDDKHSKGMPKPNETITHEGLTFYFELYEEPVQMETLSGEPPPKLADGMRLIRVRVFDSYEIGPGNFRKTDKLAELVRPYHILVAIFRNDDSMRRNLLNQEFLRDLQGIAP